MYCSNKSSLLCQTVVNAKSSLSQKINKYVHQLINLSNAHLTILLEKYTIGKQVRNQDFAKGIKFKTRLKASIFGLNFLRDLAEGN